MTRGLTDSHCHLDGPKIAPRLDAVIDRAREAGVDRVLTVSSEPGDYAAIADLAARLREGFAGAWAAVGLHPHQARLLDDDHRKQIRAACGRSEVIAVGETGLDYHYEHSPREAQQEAFRAHVRLARDLGLPVVIHSREAEDDTIRIIEQEKLPEVGGVLHCFTSSRWLAERAVEMGLFISFSGILTFPSATDLQETAAWVPDACLLVETDSPYLAPVPHRGKTCEPAFVERTAAFLAGIRGVSPAHVAELTSSNFDRAFRLP